MNKQTAWLDVCLKNIVIFLGALNAIGIDGDVVWNALRQIITDSATWTGDRTKRLAQTWVGLEAYQVIEDAVVEALGHPYHLAKVGRHSPHVSFGWSEALEKRMLKSLIRFITSPRVAVRQVALAAKAFNVNKVFRFVVDRPDRCIFAVDYLRGPNGKTRDPEKDSRSLLFYIRGLFESLAPIWPLQGKHGSVKYLTVNIRPEAVLARELPDATVEYRGIWLYVNDKRRGRIIHLRRDRRTDTFLGEYESTPGDNSIAAVLMDEDVNSLCTRTHTPLPLLRAGEIYRYQVAIPTHIELRWRTNWFFRLVEMIPGLLKPLEQGLGSEERMATAEARAAAEYARRQQFQTTVEADAPTKQVAEELIDGVFQEGLRPTLALQFDMKGFTKLSNQWGPEKTAHVLRQVFARMTEATRNRGFWPYKRVGDALVVIYAEWSRQSDEPDQYSSLAAAARGLSRLAFEFQEIIKEFEGVQLRIGIGYGTVMWHNQSLEPNTIRFEGIGEAINWAARIESKGARAGEVAATAAFCQLANDGTVPASVTEPRPSVVVNEDESIECYRLIRPIPDPNLANVRPLKLRGPAGLTATTEPQFTSTVHTNQGG